MSPAESNRHVEQLIAEIDGLSSDIERRGKTAAGHLRNAALKVDGTA